MPYQTHMGDYYGGLSGGMMFGAWPWLAGLTWIVWLAVGILAIIWLWKQISKSR